MNYSYKIFKEHLEKSNLKSIEDCTVCELGPDNSAYTAYFVYMLGANKTYLVDVGCFIDLNKNVPKILNDICTGKKRKLLFDNNITQKEMLKKVNSDYSISGLESLSRIGDNSVDFLFSNAVLEHVSLNDFDKTLKEIYRIMKVGSVSTHVIDLKDHLHKSLNNLRFSNSLWESDLFKKSGFYTNRLRFEEIIKKIEDCGFHIKNISKKYFEKMPLNKDKLYFEYRDMDDSNLLIKEFDVVLVK